MIYRPQPSLPAVEFTATVPPPSLVNPVKSQELKSNEYPDVQFWVHSVDSLTITALDIELEFPAASLTV